MFNSHFYGSVLWNLYEKESSMVFITWSTSVRKIFQLNRRSHRYLIERTSEMPHIKQALIQRSVGFIKRLSSSRKGVLRIVFATFKKDCRTTKGSKEHYVGEHPLDDQWRIPLMKNLMDIWDGISDGIGWGKDELEATIDFLCTTWIWKAEHRNQLIC